MNGGGQRHDELVSFSFVFPFLDRDALVTLLWFRCARFISRTLSSALHLYRSRSIFISLMLSITNIFKITSADIVVDVTSNFDVKRSKRRATESECQDWQSCRFVDPLHSWHTKILLRCQL